MQVRLSRFSEKVSKSIKNRGLNGWIECFDKAELKGYVFCGGVTMGGEISENIKLKKAYDMGAGV